MWSFLMGQNGSADIMNFELKPGEIIDMIPNETIFIEH